LATIVTEIRETFRSDIASVIKRGNPANKFAGTIEHLRNIADFIGAPLPTRSRRCKRQPPHKHGRPKKYKPEIRQKATSHFQGADLIFNPQAG
jgi:hypothetical protein